MYTVIKIMKVLHLISAEHFDTINAVHKIKQQKLFNKKHYLRKNPDLKKQHIKNLAKHYLEIGWKEGRNPSHKFDGNRYLQDYPDVKQKNTCPLLHYIRYGHKEGRSAYNLSGEKLVYRDSFKEKIQYAFEYPVRVYEKYHKLKDEIRNLKNSK